MMNNLLLKYISTVYSLLLVLLLIPSLSYSQVPKGVPKPTGPIDLSETSNVVIFIAIPALILIIFLIFRKRIKKVKEDKKERLRKGE